MNAWESSQREVVTAVHANCMLVNLLFVEVWKTKRLMHAINDQSTNIQFWVNSRRHMYPLGTYFHFDRTNNK